METLTSVLTPRPHGSDGSVRRELGISASVALLVAALAWWQLDARTRGAVWAEDGAFLQDRFRDGPLQSILDPYQGYLHVLPRSIVELAALLPLRDYAVAVVGLCCLSTGLIAGVIYACSRDVLHTRRARISVALITVLVPIAPVEALGNTANLHWFLLWMTPWVLLCRPTTRRQGWALGGLLLVTALSEIQTVFFVPLLLVGLRDRRRWPMVAGLLSGLVVQGIASLTVARPPSVGSPSLLDLVQGYGLHVFLQMWDPSVSGVGPTLVEQGWSLVVLASLPFLIVLAVLVLGTLRSLTTRKPWAADDAILTVTLLIGAVVPFVAGVALNFRPFLAFTDFGFDTLAIFAPLRYAVVPAMFVLSAAVVLADRMARTSRRSTTVASASLLIGLLALGLIHLDADPTLRSNTPRWSVAVAHSIEACREGAEQVQIAIAPETFSISLDCATLVGR